MIQEGLRVRLRLYLRLERLMLVLDEDDEECGEMLRDFMDPLWRVLTDDEYAWLRARGDFDSVRAFHGLHQRDGTF